MSDNLGGISVNSHCIQT